MDFPVSSSRVPDAETQARAFMTKYPERDGRDVVIAVMDTGCDPGAPGLQITSHGLPKMIDVVDCTGSGDCDTSALLGDGDAPKGPTGRTIIRGTGSAWENPSGKWHVGLKHVYDLYDANLTSRMKKERAAAFDETHRTYAAKAQSDLASFEKANPKPEGDALKSKKVSYVILSKQPL